MAGPGGAVLGQVGSGQVSSHALPSHRKAVLHCIDQGGRGGCMTA